jgi:hypothetical protein
MRNINNVEKKWPRYAWPTWNSKTQALVPRVTPAAKRNVIASSESSKAALSIERVSFEREFTTFPIHLGERSDLIALHENCGIYRNPCYRHVVLLRIADPSRNQSATGSRPSGRLFPPDSTVQKAICRRLSAPYSLFDHQSQRLKRGCECGSGLGGCVGSGLLG